MAIYVVKSKKENFSQLAGTNFTDVQVNYDDSKDFSVFLEKLKSAFSDNLDATSGVDRDSLKKVVANWDRRAVDNMIDRGEFSQQKMN